MKKALILKGDSYVAVMAMFIEHGFESFSISDPDIGKPDVIVFTGGADVSPYLYGEENISSSCDPIRDEYERQVYEKFSELGVPMVGICRGGQFLNVMNGGKMLQHISGHSYRDAPVRKFWPESDEVHIVREDHHQGILPVMGAKIVLRDVSDGNIEACHYEKTKSFCFQGHPEWGHKETEDLFFDLLKEYLPEVFDDNQDD